MKILTHRMTNLVMASAVTGILAVSLAACGKSADSTSSPEANTSLGNEIDDALITTRVKAALMTDLQLKSNDVKVETRKGEVLLSGFVENQSQLDEAMRMTRAVEGVKSIQNNVAIKGAATTVGKQVDDSIITGKVKAALMSDSSIQSRDIAVVTRNDEVQLSGFVSSQEQMDKAVSIASAVEGVYRVSNEMKIKK
ncbi:BON domain-containing protein [Limnohabitans sp. T6-5]|uniref:BON domain-containing protein n=1 Tax=Limnohabitans sp. T6-5 TaxID=1100724 RepID=UPI000D35CFD6|nr:BON domain-containing protein [Limnohabitans sp. T6-5]